MASEADSHLPESEVKGEEAKREADQSRKGKRSIWDAGCLNAQPVSLWRQRLVVAVLEACI